ncbi:hypothetical protein YDYSY3_21580 [Paenibacillus chitinolyticus]|nr:hypothetical protein YDYSY3_21580 [Paenibacillus chitinolyticus]
MPDTDFACRGAGAVRRYNTVGPGNRRMAMILKSGFPSCYFSNDYYFDQPGGRYGLSDRI